MGYGRGAPKGNKFWKMRSSEGFKPKIETVEQLRRMAEEYFDWVHDNPLMEAIVHQGQVNEEQAKPLPRPMTLAGMYIFMDIGHETWAKYRRIRDPEFVEEMMRIEQIIRTQKFEGAAAGLFNYAIIARDIGLKEESKVELSGANGGPIVTTAMSAEEAARTYAEMIKGVD
jgi:hypothetical protein